MPPLAIDEAAARVQAGCPTGRTGAGIPGRFGIRTQRSSDPQRSVSDESPRRATIPATRRKTREKKQDEFPGHCIIRPETYHAPGRQNRKCGRGESGASASPGARKARATGLRVAQDRSFPTEMPDEPGISAKPDYTLCYTSRSRRCFRLILPDGWTRSDVEPTGKCLHLTHSVYQRI